MKKTKILPMNLQLFAGLLTKDTMLSMKSGSESTFAEIEGYRLFPRLVEIQNRSISQH